MILNNDCTFTLDQVLTGKSCRIGKKEFLSTREYIEPFMESMAKYTNDFRVNVKQPKIVTYDNKGIVCKEDLTFTRILVQAILPDEYGFNNYRKAAVMVIGLDVRRPVAKFAVTGLNMCCTNMTIFNPDFLTQQEIESSTPLNYSIIEFLMDEEDKMIDRLSELKNREFDCCQTNKEKALGKWIDNALKMEYEAGFGKTKFGASDVINAYKMLFLDRESPYYVDTLVTDYGNIYESMTQTITNSAAKDPLNSIEKTLLVSKILDI